VLTVKTRAASGIEWRNNVRHFSELLGDDVGRMESEMHNLLHFSKRRVAYNDDRQEDRRLQLATDNLFTRLTSE
jgi:hypothetical protein